MVKWVLAALAALNVASFAAYGYDKKIAQRNGLRDDDIDKRRVSEKALFIWAALGPIGAVLGMKLWRHKTKHWYFVWGVPAILIAELALAAWWLFRYL